MLSGRIRPATALEIGVGQTPMRAKVKTRYSVHVVLFLGTVGLSPLSLFIPRLLDCLGNLCRYYISCRIVAHHFEMTCWVSRLAFIAVSIPYTSQLSMYVLQV